MIDKKKALITFAVNGRENYCNVVGRVAASAIANGFNGDCFLYLPTQKAGKQEYNDRGNFIEVISDYPTTETYGKCKFHVDVPYGFKPFAFQHCLELGYEQVMWMDSTAAVVSDIRPTFDFLDSIWMLMPDNPGCPLATWTSDDCLEQIGAPIEEARKFYEIMACVQLFDFTYPKSREILKEWIEYSMDGISFQGYGGSDRPDYKAHRHDQSVISWLLYKNAISHIPYGWLIYPSFQSEYTYNPVVINNGTGPLPPRWNQPILDFMNKLMEDRGLI